MHEMALAENIVDMVVQAAEGAGAVRVKTVYLTIGAARDVVVDLLDGLIRHLARGTVAADAEVVILEAPVLGRCEECGATYPIDYTDLRASWDCPRCKGGRYKVVSGMQFTVDRIEVA